MKESQQRTINKAVIDLMPGDVLVGAKGGQSVVEDSSDHSGLLGFMRIETEHGHLYMELDAQVTVLAQPQEPEPETAPAPQEVEAREVLPKAAPKEATPREGDCRETPQGT